MRNKLRLSTIAAYALFAFGATSAAAQNGTVSGTITDAETGMPVSGAAVEVLGTGEAVLTSQSGQFRVSLAPGTYSVAISNLGYVTVRRDGVDVMAGSTTSLNVPLTSTALELNEIVVTASRREQKKTEAPNTTFTVSETEIEERPTTTPVDHLRAAPGVDIVTHGMQATNVVIRGFNNIFSGALHALTDNRLAGVPSLRVNLLHFIPSTNEDIERMEVVLGPGAALYGPNTANGVLHMLTKSPLNEQSTTFYMGGGEGWASQMGLRTSHLIGDNFGVKVSGQYLRGREFEFEDPVEAAARASADANPAAFKADQIARGFSPEAADIAISRVGIRDFDFKRWSGEVRADWAFSDDGTLVVQGGITSASGIELTGLGAGQTDDWKYAYYQARLNKGRFFTQAYLNSSDAGDSFLLRDGAPLVDESRLFVGQVQHGFATANDRVDLTYGVDLFYTNPRTKGTINGINENDDNITEVGAYAQAEFGLSDKVDLVVAGRWDTHTELEDDVFSPRAALVIKPSESQSFRFSFNQAFSTPTTLNFFLDISGGAAPDPLGSLGYRVRAQGPNNGFVLQEADGTLAGMRSPFNPGGPGQLLPVSTPLLWQLAVGVLGAQAPPSLAPLLPLLASLTPTDADIPIMLLDPNTLQQSPLAPGAVQNVSKLKESTTTTFEVGYQGVINNNFLLAADAWYSRREDFISPLVVRTPLIQLNGPAIAQFLAPALVASAGMDPATAAATAGQIAAAMAPIPLGVVSSSGIDASGADLLVTYVNAGTVDMYGADIAIKWLVDDRWTLAGSASWVSDDYFTDEAFAAQFGGEAEVENGIAPIALNAPEFKGNVSVGYRNTRSGFNGEGRLRYQSGFPAESAGFVGTACLTDGTGLFEEPCVDRYLLLDVTLGYKIPNSQATLQLTVNNLLDTGYRSFVGVPEIGRVLMARIRYDIF